MAVRVLVVDDNPLFREGLANLLTQPATVEVVGVAGSGEEALRRATALRPQVVLMDAAMPGMGGVAGTQHLLAQHPDVAVCMLAVSDQQAEVFAGVCAGARGALVKTVTRANWHTALTVLAAGGAVVGPQLAAQLLDDFAAAVAGGLTGRERDVLQRLARGDSIDVVAHDIAVETGMVTAQLRAILDKLHARHRADDDGLQGAGVPRRPSPGGLSAAEAPPSTDDENHQSATFA